MTAPGHTTPGHTAPAPFDVCGPLPEGVTVLEASAGTGKTFTIAALAARYVAEGIPLAQLLLVTFTRMATGELRERVRDRLVSAEQGLAHALAGFDPPADDEVLNLLASGAPEDVGLRRRRLAAALADFDAATIATTHGFCRRVLTSLGVVGDIEDDVTFVDDLDDLVTEAVDDLYVRRFHWTDHEPPFDRAEALRIARTAVDNPLAPVEPRTENPNAEWAMRRRLAQAAREEVDARKRRTRVLTSNDLLTRLAETLADPQRGRAACQRLREHYRVALVDEFQDTDPVQWQIMQHAFGGGDATLVLIGDPKQAIYGFRGADVHAYLDAKRTAGRHQTLPINWRCDQGLIDAYDALLGGLKLGHEEIAYTQAPAAAAHQTSRLSGAPSPTPLRVRVAHRDDGLVGRTPKGYAAKQAAQHHVAADLAADVVALLEAGAEVSTRYPDGSTARRERVRPPHIGVLVHTNKQAALVRDALEAVAVPAVINGAGSVFATPAATDWQRLLEALERPTSPTRARTAALTVFVGWTAEEVAAAGEADWERVHTRLHRWAEILRRGGVATLLALLTSAEELPARVLGRADGERTLTDLRHVGQLLHAQATAEHLGVAALVGWLRQRIAGVATDTRAEERSRRLESDAEAVQVLTMHRSKGLEFPIAYYPFLWDPRWIDPDEPPVFHDPDAGEQRTINVGNGGPGYSRHRLWFVQEQRGEDLRLAYVALTRACHQAVVWWAGTWDSRDSPLARVLFARDEHGNVAAGGRYPPDDEEVVARVEELTGQAPGCGRVERTGQPDTRHWAGDTTETRDLGVRGFDRRLDEAWERTSYTAIVGGRPTTQLSVASEPDEPSLDDEAPASGAVDATPWSGDPPDTEEERHLWGHVSPLTAMPGGAAVGTLVHDVLEATDFTASDLDAELDAHLDRQRIRRHLRLEDPGAVVAGLRAALETPLGPLADDRRLRDVGRHDRVDELSFELPLAGGDTPTATPTVGTIAGLLRRHLPGDDPLAGYADRLDDPQLRRELRGYLAGSIDCVLRLRDQRTRRYLVCDYKTNRLGGPASPSPTEEPATGSVLTAWHYRPAALGQAMQQAHYPLQALLYMVALHRYLRWRLPGYDPEVNLGGVAYLFLRGMTGADAPRIGGYPCGVFAWTPPPGLIIDLSDALDHGTVGA